MAHLRTIQAWQANFDMRNDFDRYKQQLVDRGVASLDACSSAVSAARRAEEHRREAEDRATK